MYENLSHFLPSGEIRETLRPWGSPTLDLPDLNAAVPITGQSVAEDLRVAAFMALEDTARVGTWEYDVSADQLRWSPGTYRLYRQSPRDFTPTTEAVLDFYTPASRSVMSTACQEALEGGRSWDLELELEGGGQQRRIRAVGIPQRGADGRVVRLIGYVFGVQECRDDGGRQPSNWHAEKIHLDTLTGLPNRRWLDGELRRRLSETGRRDAVGWLLHLDMDRFRMVVEACGEAMGDRLIREVSTLLRDTVQPQDLLVRIGGDKFGLLIDDVNAAAAVKRATTLIDAVSAFRFETRSHQFTLGLSVGGAAIDATAAGAIGEVLRRAAVSCKTARRQGGNRAILYDREDALIVRVEDEMGWGEQIQLGIEERRFELHAQRIVCLDGSRAPSYEILLRLRGRDGELILPDKFLPGARRYGLMSALDRHVVELVLAQWHSGLLSAHPYDHITVNLSGFSLCDAAFTDFLLSALAASGIPPSRLYFEITESEAFSSMRDAAEVVKRLRGLGFRVLLDDFGNGYTSFQYLRTLAIDGLKIDNSFTHNLDRDRFNQTIVSSICQVGAALDLEVIVEGIETEATLKVVKRLGVRHAQGWLFHRPEPLAQALASGHGAGIASAA